MNTYRYAILLALIFNQTLAAQTPAAAPEKLMSEMDWTELSLKWHSLASAGQPEASLPYARAALEVARRDSGEASLAYGQSFDNLGYSLHHSGRLAESETAFRTAVAHGKKHLGETHEDHISRLNNLGMLYKSMGDHAQAISCLEYAFRLAEAHMSEDSPDFAIIVSNLGVLYEAIGKHDRALQYYLRTLALTERAVGKDHWRYGKRLSNIASAYISLGELEKSYDFARRGLATIEKSLGRNHLQCFIALGILRRTCFSAQKYEEALTICDSMLTIAQRIGIEDKVSFYDMSQGFASSYFMAGQYERCLGFSREMLQKFRAQNPKDYSRHLWHAGFAAASLEKMGRLPEATQFALQHHEFALGELREVFRSFSEQEQLSYYQTTRQWLHNLHLLFAIRHPEQAGISGAAFDYEMNIKGLSLSNRNQLLRSLRNNPQQGELAAQFADWQMLQTETARQSSLPLAKRSPQFDSLQNRANELERSLALGSEAFRLAKQSARWQDVQAALPDGAAAIEFANITPSDITRQTRTDSVLYCAWVLRPGDREPRFVYLFEEKELSNLDATRRLYDPQPNADGQNLHQLLWEKLAPALVGTTKIWYAPAGLLNQINMAAVPISATEVLADRFELHRVVSTRSVLALKNPTQNTTTAPATALVFGGIRYETDSLGVAVASPKNVGEQLPFDASRGEMLGEDWGFLAGSLKEAQDARARLGASGTRVTFADGFAASEDFFKKTVAATPSPEVLHLATHGFFQTQIDTSANTAFAAARNPMVRAGLVLAGGNRAWQGELPPAGMDDGILTALEISNLDLRNTRLAVLSACGTGQGKSQAGEGVLGLQRAFKMAGTGYVIMTLWNVNDRHAQEFMHIFYEAWLTRKMPIPDAFRSAQQRMRARYSKPFQPTAWAGFVLLE